MAGVRTKTAALTAEDVGLKNNPNQHIPTIYTGGMDYESLGKLKYEVLSDKTVKFGSEMAAAYIDLPIFPGEREVGDAHVQFLYDEMRKGTFNPLLVICSTAVLNGVTFKINGQHFSWAILYMCEKKKDFSFDVREIRYKVTSEEQLKLLYATYDRLKARTDAHISRVFLVGTQAAEGIWNRVVNQAVGGFKFWHVEADPDRRRISPEQLAAVIQREFAELFRTVAMYVQDHQSDSLTIRQATLAAMFATFQKVPTKAPEFWTPVLDGLNITAKTDPRYALREALLKVATKPTRKTGEGKEKRLMSNEDIYRICISAFNKWRKNETVQVALRATKERVKPI